MSFAIYRARALLCACIVAAIAALSALAFAPVAGAAQVGSTYLALGDSLAYGFHEAQFKSELETKGFVEPATFNDGYVDDFGAALKLIHPNLQIVNDGCPGETTETFIKARALPGSAPAVRPELCSRTRFFTIPTLPTHRSSPTRSRFSKKTRT